MASARKSRVRVSVVPVLTLAICLLWCSYAEAFEPPVYVRSFGPDGTPATEFNFPGPLAFDQQQSVLYVEDHEENELLKFDGEGQPVAFTGTAPYISGNRITGLSLAPANGETQVAVDSSSHVFYVTDANQIRAFQENGEPADFSAGPGAGTNLIGGFVKISGLAVDSNGSIYASDKESGVVKVYAASGEVITQFSATEPANLAVNSAGAVYVNTWHGTVHKFTPDEIPVAPATTFSESASPLESTPSYSVAVDPATNNVYVTQEFFAPGIAVFAEDGTPLGRFAGPGEEGELKGSEGIVMDAGAERLFVSNESKANVNQVEIFEPFHPPEGPPTIDWAAVSSVTSSSATFYGEIHPNSRPTTYRFEYGPTACSASVCTDVPIGGVGIGDGFEGIPVSQHVSQLQPNTTYHFRLAATNEFDTTFGVEQTFTTQGVNLADESGDGRVWEMVSPVNKFDGNITTSPLGIVQAGASGNGIAYLSRGSIEEGAAGNRSPEVSSVLASRAGGRWLSKDITPPHTEATLIRGHSEYKLFAPELNQSIMEPRDRTPLSPESSEMTAYLRTEGEPAVFKPLVTSKEPYANVSPEIHFAEASEARDQHFIALWGANSTLSHVVLSSEVPLVEGAEGRSLYLWSGGSLEPVSVLPEGDTGAEGKPIARAILGSGIASTRHAVSEDGSLIFWSKIDSEGHRALYVRDTVGNKTGRLDVAETGASGSGVADAMFQGASADGKTVFFTDTAQLTVGASPEGRDLYRCEIGSVEGEPGCAVLEDITPPSEGSGESSEVLGLLPGISADGNRLYFVAQGVLDDGSNSQGEEPVAGQPNLYFWEENGEVRFIGRLSLADKPDWGNGEIPSGASLSAASSPNGWYLSFMSERALTGYDNRNPKTGEVDEEVFAYDAASGGLTCLSCNPTGASAVGQKRPAGFEEATALIDRQETWRLRSVAGTLPEPATIQNIDAVMYYPRSVLDNGRVFFNASDPLVPADSNSQWDAYQFEPFGTGSCSTATDGKRVSRTNGGCVGLISSGTAAGESAILDASITGNDVFFLTRGRLSRLDQDDATDVYDARVGGEEAQPGFPVECSGEACQQGPEVAEGTVPDSSTYNGSGNLRAAGKCHHGTRKPRSGGKRRCIRRHKHSSRHKRGRGHR